MSKSSSVQPNSRFQINIDGIWRDYGADEDRILKRSYAAGEDKLVIRLRGHRYAFNFRVMHETNLQSGRVRPIRTPPWWQGSCAEEGLPSAVVPCVQIDSEVAEAVASDIATPRFGLQLAPSSSATALVQHLPEASAAAVRLSTLLGPHTQRDFPRTVRASGQKIQDLPSMALAVSRSPSPSGLSGAGRLSTPRRPRISMEASPRSSPMCKPRNASTPSVSERPTSLQSPILVASEGSPSKIHPTTPLRTSIARANLDSSPEKVVAPSSARRTPRQICPGFQVEQVWDAVAETTMPWLPRFPGMLLGSRQCAPAESQCKLVATLAAGRARSPSPPSLLALEDPAEFEEAPLHTVHLETAEEAEEAPLTTQFVVAWPVSPISLMSFAGSNAGDVFAQTTPTAMHSLGTGEASRQTQGALLSAATAEVVPLGTMRI